MHACDPGLGPGQEALHHGDRQRVLSLQSQDEAPKHDVIEPQAEGPSRSDERDPGKVLGRGRGMAHLARCLTVSVCQEAAAPQLLVHGPSRRLPETEGRQESNGVSDRERRARRQGPVQGLDDAHGLWTGPEPGL